MRIAVLGGGPAGLYFALLMKKANPSHDITTFERNASDSTFGWGVVFSDQTMDGFRAADEQVVNEIEANFHHWDDIDVHFKDRKISSSGHGFCGIARLKLTEIFQKRCAELCVKMVWETEVTDPDVYAKSYDLVIGADGVFSAVRKKHEAHFNPRIDVGSCRFIWLGTKKKLDAFTFAFKETEHGWFNLHAYRFNSEMSTFIIEAPEPTWQRAGLDSKEPADAIAFCEHLFADLLDGHALISNARHLRGSAVWLKFNRVLCERWYKDNIVLIGDAAHTAHFGIGSGTKLAMEDAISLVRVLNSAQGSVPERLAMFQAEREVEALKLQSAARNRMTWFEGIDRYVSMAPEQFAFSLLTGSQRVGHANQKLRDAHYTQELDRWFAAQTGVEVAADKSPPPPMFTPFKLRDLVLSNRVVVSPMCTYSAVDGVAGDFHFQHYTARALGGAALVMTEMTVISAEGRISPGCTGIWNEAHVDAWRRITDFAHANSDAKLALQIGHAGRKGSTRLAWDGMDQPLAEGNWPLIAPSALPYLNNVSQTPREMNRADMDQIKADFVVAAQRAEEAGFDMIEFHAAHGYLMSSFLSPLTNLRQDNYGGSLENRCRYPVEVFKALRAAWPAKKPMSVRLSAHDWAPGGNTPTEATQIAKCFQDAGADIIHVSSGQVVKEEKPVYGRMFQVPFSDRIRNDLQIPTITVGNIFEADHVNTIIAAGRADLCALARPHLADPAWTLHAAAEQGYTLVRWPKPYVSGKFQLERNLDRMAQLALNV